MPIPTLHIDDEALGQPRQPVPLRLACLVPGLTCADFRCLLTFIQQRSEAHLAAYDHRSGEVYRAVRPD